MTDQPVIDPEEAAREAALRRAAVQQQTERQEAFDAEWGDRIANATRVLVAYGVTEVRGYPGWGQDSAKLTPKLDITGDAAVLAWIVVRLHEVHPDDANRLLALSAPWLRPIFQIATGQKITPSKSIETLTLADTPILDSVFTHVVPAADSDELIAGMLPPLPPEPEEPSPYAGILLPSQPANDPTRRAKP